MGISLCNFLDRSFNPRFSLVFILIALGHALGRISNIRHSVIAGVIGAGLWLISFRTIDDYWLFFPVFKLFDLFGLY
ncbi:MAG: hypothetical protein AB1510_11625 [Bacillota bacterium]